MNPRKLTLMMILLLTGLAAACNTPSAEKTTPVATAATPEASKAAATAPPLPSAFPAPEGEEKTQEVAAVGVQIYTCAPKKDDATQFAWTLKAPEATLTDTKGYKIGKHYGTPDGPAWEANDGSKVIGDADKRQARPAPDTIPWLLLPAKSATGKGIFGAVKSIQRLNTEKGTAPATGCDKANAGKEVRVDYKATYYFYGTKLK